MHLLRFIISYVMVTAFGLVLLAFLALNHDTVELDLLAWQYSVSLAWVMVGAALFGLVITLLLLLPGRIATAVNAWRVERDLQEMEQQYGQLQAWRAHALTQHEFLLERHERMLLRYQHLVTDHRETVAELDRIRAQLASTAASTAAARAAQAATSSVAHASGIEQALRRRPQTAPVASVPLHPATSSATRFVEQPPATYPAARTAGDTLYDAQPEQSNTQRQPRPQPVAASSASSMSSIYSGPQRVATPASAPTATGSIPRRVPVVPVLTAPAAPFTIPIAATPPAASVPPAAQPMEPPVAVFSALQRPLERLLAEVRHGRQGVVELDGRLRYRVSMLRAKAEAQMNAHLSRLQRRITAVTIDESDDMPGHNERRQTGVPASNDADETLRPHRGG